MNDLFCVLLLRARITNPRDRGIFKNWSELSEADKLLLKNIPEEWIPSVYQFRDFCFIRKFSPIEIPNSVIPKPKPMPNGYLQVYFKFRDNTFKYVVRAHTEIPNVPFGAGQGSVWRVHREIINDGTITTYSEHLCGTDWIRGRIYYDAIEHQKLGIATPYEIQILDNSHFKIK